MRFKKLLLVLVLFPHYSLCFAQDDLESFERKQQFEEMEKTIDRAKAALTEMSGNVKGDCFKATGNNSFCACLASKLPIILTFQNYVHIVTTSKLDLKYHSLDEDGKKLIDMTRGVREKCVSENTGFSRAVKQKNVLTERIFDSWSLL